MIKTKNDLPEATRKKIIAILNERLADAIDLSIQAKQAHWNVKGPHFIALHELFDKVAEVVEGSVDEIAERAVQLGGIAEGTVRIAAKKSTLKEYPLSIIDGEAHVKALADAMAIFGKNVRKAIDLSSELKDADTADLFTEISREADKYLWFVEAHLQASK